MKRPTTPLVSAAITAVAAVTVSMSSSAGHAATNPPPVVDSESSPDVGFSDRGATSYTFTITYRDDAAIDASTIDVDDVAVSGVATTLLVVSAEASSTTNTTPLTAVYTVRPPGGSWDAADDGTYTIALSGNQVGDVGSPQAFVSADSALGSFTVSVSDGPIENGQVSLRDGVLLIVGTGEGDRVHVVSAGPNLKVVASFLNDAQPEFELQEVDSIVAQLREGGDHITISDNLQVPATVLGGPGNDRLVGGSGSSVLVGNAGDDFLLGGGGHDILIGGDGSDGMVGAAGDDLLIGGTTDHDANGDDLQRLRAEWSSDQGYSDRVSIIRTGGGSLGGTALNDVTVHDDLDVDRLTGAADRDWFFSGVGDRVTDRSSDEEQD